MCSCQQSLCWQPVFLAHKQVNSSYHDYYHDIIQISVSKNDKHAWDIITMQEYTYSEITKNLDYAVIG